MNTTVNFTTESGKSYSVEMTAKHIGTTTKFSNGINNVFNVKAKVGENSVSFKYHTSQADYNNGIHVMDAQNLQFALHCLLMDAISGEMSLEDFISEFGYDNKTGRNIHRKCEKQLEKATFLFSDIYEACNALNELENAQQ